MIKTSLFLLPKRPSSIKRTAIFLRCLGLMCGMLYALFNGTTASARLIQDLPNFHSITICFAGSPVVCAGWNKSQFSAQPDSLIPASFDGRPGTVLGGLSDQNGNLSKGDNFFVLYLNSFRPIDSVYLFFSDPFRQEFPLAVVSTANLVFSSGYGPDDLSNLLAQDGNYVGIQSGTIVFSFASSSPSPTPFLCYKTAIMKRRPRQELGKVTLTDQFEAGGVEVRKAESLCTPADKDGQGIIDPVTHLQGYLIKSTRPKKLKISNQLGSLYLDLLEPDGLFVPTAKNLHEPVEPLNPDGHNVDHYKCYGTKVTRGTPAFPKGIQTSIVDQFNQPKVYEVEKPTKLCVPTDKNGEGLKNPGAHLLCYQVQPAKDQPKHATVTNIHVNNEFGSEQLNTVIEEELCLLSFQDED